MEGDLIDSAPCSSLAVDAVLRSSTAGAVWGSCYGPFEAKRLGLFGRARTMYIAKYMGSCGFSCGLFAALFSFSHCGLQRYRQRKDWLNTLGAGVVTGVAFGVQTRNMKQVVGITCLFCTIFHFTKDSESV